jgi:hypothetical protein
MFGTSSINGIRSGNTTGFARTGLRGNGNGNGNGNGDGSGSGGNAANIFSTRSGKQGLAQTRNGGQGATTDAAPSPKCPQTGKWVAVGFGIACVLAIIALVIALVIANQRKQHAESSTAASAATQAKQAVTSRAQTALAQTRAANAVGSTKPRRTPPTNPAPSVDSPKAHTSSVSQSSPATGTTTPHKDAMYASPQSAMPWMAATPSAAAPAPSAAWSPQYNAAVHDTSSLMQRMHAAQQTERSLRQAATSYALHGGPHPVAYTTGGAGGAGAGAAYKPYMGVPPPPSMLAATMQQPVGYGFAPTAASALESAQKHHGGPEHVHLAHTQARTSAINSPDLWTGSDIARFAPADAAKLDAAMKSVGPQAFFADDQSEQDRRYRQVVANLSALGRVDMPWQELKEIGSPYIATAQLIRKANRACTDLSRSVINPPVLRFLYDSPLERQAISMPVMTLSTDSMTPAQEAYYLSISCNPPCNQYDGF